MVSDFGSAANNSEEPWNSAKMPDVTDEERE